MQKRITALSWCGIFILCLAVCFQLLGVPGTLLNFADSEDDFQASVMTGYSITTAPVSFLPRLTTLLAISNNHSINAFLSPDVPFHPPLFL
jgi:hypothetical protein